MTIRLDHLLVGVLLAAVVAVLGVVAAPRLLHHDGSKSFTLKMSVVDSEAYMVMSVPAADFSGLRDSVFTTLRDSAAAGSQVEGLGGVYLTEQKPEGLPLACTQSGRLGESGQLDPALQPYTGDQVAVKIYGSGMVADFACQDLQQGGF